MISSADFYGISKLISWFYCLPRGINVDMTGFKFTFLGGVIGYMLLVDMITIFRNIVSFQNLEKQQNA